MVLCYDRTDCVRFVSSPLIATKLIISQRHLSPRPAHPCSCDARAYHAVRHWRGAHPSRYPPRPKGARALPYFVAAARRTSAPRHLRIEDICAVDGSGGTQFRQRLNLRYQASKAFREMLHRQTLFWAIGAIACSITATIIVFTIQRDAAYVVRIFSLPANSKLTPHRSAGSCPSSGLVFGPPSPSPGSSAT
jgi:hypothetical protein